MHENHEIQSAWQGHNYFCTARLHHDCRVTHDYSHNNPGISPLLNY